MPGKRAALQAFRAPCRKARTIWPRLDCLKPNSQSESDYCRNNACNRRPAMPGHEP